MNLEDYPTPKTNAFGFEITIPGADRPGVVQAVVPYDIAQDLERKLAMCRQTLKDVWFQYENKEAPEWIKQTLEQTK